MDFTAAAAATRLWSGFSRFMAANGLTLFTTVALIISLCFFSAICYFLFRLLETVRWRESLAGINWRNWSLGSLFRSQEKKDEVEEEEDDEEDDEDEEYESEYDEDEMNAFKADVEMICKMSDEDLEKLALLIAEERKKKMMATATTTTSTTTDSHPE